MSGKEETTARTAATRPGPVQVELGYHWATFHARRSLEEKLEEKIELASHKPLGAYVARRFPEGWRWVPYDGRIGPKMELVFDSVMDNPGCCKADATWAAGLSSPYIGTWGPIERAIYAGLITAEYVHRNRFRLFACGFDRREYYGQLPQPMADGYWHPQAHP
jgi:hypothetical protein